MPKRTKKNNLRLIVQIIFLLLIILISYNHYRVENNLDPILYVGSPSLHAVCPFGGVVSIYTYITSNSFVKKIHQSSFTLMFLVLFLTLLFGPAFCGWICPFGTIQEWIGKLGKKIFKKRYNTFIPLKIHNIAKYFRYVVLIWVLVNTAIIGKLLFANIDPYYALFNFWSSEVTITSLIFLGIIIVSSLFIERPFCKYFCPFGAVLGLFNFIRIFKLRRNEKTCISCKLCDIKCPMLIDISTKNTISSPYCISCMECTEEFTCPVDNTLQFKLIKLN